MSIGPDIRMVVKNMREFRNELARQGKAVRGAGEVAVKVEGFRLRLALAMELRMGRPSVSWWFS